MTMTAASKRRDFNSFLLTTLTEEKKEADRMSEAMESVERTSVNRIVGLVEGRSADDDEFEIELNDANAYIEDVFRRSLEEFQVRSDSPHISEIDSDGFGEQLPVLYPPWSCLDCTFMNEERNAPFCEICGGARPDTGV